MSSEKATEIFVDPVNGKDANPGTQDAPLLTLEAAKAKVKVLVGSMKGDIIVSLRGGHYKPLHESRQAPLFNLFGGEGEAHSYPLRVSSLAFDESDSGCGGYRVIYQSYPGERAVISGGREIGDWRLHDGEKNIYRAFAGPGTETRQLYVNGRRAERARSRSGFSGGTVYDPECRQTGGPAYVTEDLSLLEWGRVGDVEFVYPRGFTMSRCGVERVQQEGDRLHIYMKQPGWHYITHKYGTSAKLPAWIENAYELLDTPGAWYLDREEGYIYYIPLAEENMELAVAVIPEIDVLLSVKGSSLDRKAGNLQFRHIDFEYTGWLRPNYENGHCDSQNNYIRESIGQEFDSDHQSDAAVELEYADHIVLEGCRFSKMGITAVRMTKACRNNRIEGCEIHDISGGGISIGDPEFRNPESRSNYLPEREEEIISDNRILNNYIHDIAVEYMSATAISAAFTRNTEIGHNEICRVPYSGLHIGYGWDVPDTSCTQGMKIRHNVVDTFMTRMFDGGGMYFIGATGGTPDNPNVIRGNYIRNQMEPKYGGFYFDEGSSNWQAEDNVFENTELWCNISGISKKLHDVSVTRTWLTNGYSYSNPSLGQKGVIIEEPQVFPRRNWPEHVEELIGSAGLSPQYAALRPDYYDLGQVWFETDELVLDSGTEATLRLNVRTVRGVRIGNLSADAVSFTSDRPEIAEVDEKGRVKAVSGGKCTVLATVGQGGTVKSARMHVYVDDAVVQAEILPRINPMPPNFTQKLSVICHTRLGRCFAAEEASFRSDNPGVAQVDSRGIVTAAADGAAAVYACLAAQGGRERGRLEAALVLQVRSTPSGDPVSDPGFWKASPDMVISNGAGWLEAASEGGIGTAVYGGSTYGDGVLAFDLLLQAGENELVCLYLRSRNDSGRAFDSGNSGYVVVISPKCLELHRFHDRQRTQFYGNVFPFPSLAGAGIANTYIESGRACHVELGAFNTAAGVRLVMKVDDRTVFDYTDELPEAIRSPGYFGLTVTRGSIKLAVPHD
jgi:hypothetical protein